MGIIALLAIIVFFTFSTNKSTRIKYDITFMKIAKVVGIVCACGIVIGIALIILHIPGTELAIVVLMEICGVLGIYFGYSFFCGRLYFNRLKKYGYEIPFSRKDYGNDIRNLKRIREPETSIYGVEARRICFVVCIGLLVVFFGMDIKFYQEWKFMREECIAVLIPIMLFHLFWILYAVLIKIQENKSKYRDDAEYDEARKERYSVERIILTIVIIAAFSLFAVSTASSMTKYVYKTKISSDRDKLMEISNSVAKIIGEYDGEYDDLLRDESYIDLCSGVDITSMDTNDNDVAYKLCERLGIVSLSELKDDFNYADGDAVVFVTVSEQEVFVELQNPIEAVMIHSDKSITKVNSTIAGSDE